MKKYFLCLISLLCYCSAILSAASIESLLEKLASKKSSYKDMTVETTMTPYNREGKPASQTAVSKTYYKGNKYRAEMTVSDNGKNKRLSQVTVFDGDELWAVSENKAQRMPKMMLMRYKWEVYGTSAAVKGSEIIEGRYCHIIEPYAFPQMRFWVDDKSLETVKIESAADKITINSSKFRPTGRMFEMPYHTETLLNGKTMSVTNVESITFDTGLSDDLFVVHSSTSNIK